MTKKTALVIGGSSSLAQSFICALDSFNIFTSTTRREELKTSDSEREVFYLDISRIQVIESFLDQIKGREFDFVINLIGALSYFESAVSYSKMKEYLEVHSINLLYLFDNLFSGSRVAKNGKILHLSSRAAKYGSFDRFYAASKSSIEGYIRAAPKSINSEVTINAISVGSILDSRMYLDMEVSIQNQHLQKSGNKLLNSNQVAQSVIQILMDSKIKSGQIIELGPQYE